MSNGGGINDDENDGLEINGGGGGTLYIYLTGLTQSATTLNGLINGVYEIIFLLGTIGTTVLFTVAPDPDDFDVAPDSGNFVVAR